MDFIVDPFPLWEHLGEDLAPLFHNPRVLKVLHGAESDVLWLQRDFGLYLVNLWDTFNGARALMLPACSFAYLLEYYCRKHTDKKFQLADWTTRPLSEEMLRYAQMDTHYLLYIYDRLRIDLYNLAI
jgi:exosome complex exonuclease RRP6